MIGFVESFVDLPDGSVLEDPNGFVTALAARALRGAGRPVPTEMLEALVACGRADGSYGFWPEGAAPAWARELPGDSDDTAIMALELWRAGWIDTAAARRAAGRIVRHRIVSVPRLGPPWLRAGTFALWHRPGLPPSMVDCTATANMLALLSATDLLHLPGSGTAIAMLGDAIEWAGSDRRRAASLSPFYPNPCEFAFALGHAVACGAEILAPLAAATAALPWGNERPSREPSYAICSSPYGTVCWRSPELAAIRHAAGTKEDATSYIGTR